ncbi:DUF421 domain-containing protein [Lysinibacillus sp. KU-BSD001]|uniref:DUF421 domain-containing protein n=1 Tax=Lysinibacillus sp. KU-BSD001 TaxID=3141328 RepID=UPI0036E3B320
MAEFWIIAFRTIVLYIIVLLVFRLMGKREVGELSLLDFAVYVLIAEVASLAIDNLDRSLVLAVVPIVLLFTIQYLNALFILKNKKMRDTIDGDPTIIIRDGVIVEAEMRKQRYNLDDLFQQLREQGISSVQSIAYAFLEPSGKLSVFKKGDEPFILPIVIDGYVDDKHLKFIGKDRKWLEDQLRDEGVHTTDEVFYCCYEGGKIHYQLKARKK